MGEDKDPVDQYLKEKCVVNYPISNMQVTMTNYQLWKLIKEYPEWLATYYIDPKRNHTPSLPEQGNTKLP